MEIFFLGLGLFVLGTALNAFGWWLHGRKIKGGVSEELLSWLPDVFRQWYPLLTAPDSTGGQRIAAFGAILAAIGLVVTVGGLVAWIG